MKYSRSAQQELDLCVVSRRINWIQPALYCSPLLARSAEAQIYYEGSIAGRYYNHQAVGVYKCCNTVYSPPTRGYQFDTNFLTPSLLPPLTPMLRTVNTVGFTQMMLPTQ